MGHSRTGPTPTVDDRDGSIADTELRKSLYSVGRATFLILIGQVAFQVLLLATRIVLIRGLSPSGYGTIVYGATMFSILSPVLNLGIPALSTRRIASNVDYRSRRTVLRLGIAGIAASALLSTVVLWFGAPYIGQVVQFADLSLVVRVLAVANIANLVIGLLSADFLGVEDVFPAVAFTMIGTPAVTVGLAALLISGGYGFEGALGAYLIGTWAILAFSLLYWYVFRGRFAVDHATARSTDQSKGKEIISVGLPGFVLASLPFAAVAIGITIPGTADVLILGLFRSATVVGAYTASIALSRVPGLAIAAVSMILLPVAARLGASGHSANLKLIYASVTKWTMAVTVPPTVVFLAYPRPSLELLYGSVAATPAYDPAVAVLQIAILATFLSSLLGPSTAVLMGTLGARALVVAATVSIVLDVIGTAYLAPIWGARGAAMAASLAYFALPVISLFGIATRLGVHPFRRKLLVPVAVILVPSLAVLYFVHEATSWSPSGPEVVLLLIVLMFLFLGCVLLTHSLEPEDVHLLTLVESLFHRRLNLFRALGGKFMK